MATPGMWELIDLFVRLYGDKLYLLPYKASIPNRQLLLISNISRKRRYFTKLCTLYVSCHTLFCFAILCEPIFKGKDPAAVETSQTIRVVRVFVQILAALLPSAFLAMNYVIAVTPVVAEVILCKIADFQKEAQGNYGNRIFPVLCY